MAFGLGTLVGVGWAAVPELRSADCGASDQLVVATGADVSLNQQRKVLIDLWNDKVRGGDPVARLEELPGVADQQRSQMFAAVQSGSCRYDVLNLDLPWIQEFYRAGLLQRLSPAGQADRFEPGGFLPPSWQAGVRDGAPYAIPFNSDVGLLYYRADVLRELKLRPPQTWADVDEISRRLHEPGTPWHGVKAAYAGQLAQYEGLTVNLLELFWAAGGDLVKNDGSVAESPQILDALKQLIERMQTVPPVVWQSSTSSHEAETIDAFADGEVVLMRNWPYAFRALAADPDLNSGGRLKFGVTGLLGGPGRPGPSVLGGQSLTVPVSSTHTAAARRLIRHLTTVQSQKLLFSCGGFSPVRDVAFDAESCAREQAHAGVAAERRAGTEQASAREEEQLKVLASTLRQAFRNVRPRPVTPYYSDFTAVLQRRVHPLLQGRPRASDKQEYDALHAGVCDSLSGAGASPSPPGCG